MLPAGRNKLAKVHKLKYKLFASALTWHATHLLRKYFAFHSLLGLQTSSGAWVYCPLNENQTIMHCTQQCPMLPTSLKRKTTILNMSWMSFHSVVYLHLSQALFFIFCLLAGYCAWFSGLRHYSWSSTVGPWHTLLTFHPNLLISSLSL